MNRVMKVLCQIYKLVILLITINRVNFHLESELSIYVRFYLSHVRICLASREQLQFMVMLLRAVSSTTSLNDLASNEKFNLDTTISSRFSAVEFEDSSCD